MQLLQTGSTVVDESAERRISAAWALLAAHLVYGLTTDLVRRAVRTDL